jgi:hypothetical protein
MASTEPATNVYVTFGSEFVDWNVLAKNVGPSTAPITTTRRSPVTRLSRVQMATVTERRSMEEGTVFLLNVASARSTASPQKRHHERCDQRCGQSGTCCRKERPWTNGVRQCVGGHQDFDTLLRALSDSEFVDVG